MTGSVHTATRDTTKVLTFLLSIESPNMSVSPIVQQTIDIFANAEKTKSDIATAVLTKQLNADKQLGQAVVQLIEQAAATPTRGIDVKA